MGVILITFNNKLKSNPMSTPVISEPQTKEISLEENGILDVINKIDELGFNKNAERIKNLINLPEDEFEPGDCRLREESILNFYCYLLHGNYFDIEPEIGFHENDGFLSAQWILANDTGIITVIFQNNKNLKWGITLGSGKSKISKDGNTNYQEFNQTLELFKVNKS